MVLKQNLSEAMYASDVDIIYAAAGGAGLGVFAAAKSIVEANPDRKIWVIGVDQDQQAEGKVNDSRNVTLTSTLKGVKQALIKFSEDASKGNYHGGEQVLYGLSDNGVGLADGQLSDSVKEKIAVFKKSNHRRKTRSSCETLILTNELKLRGVGVEENTNFFAPTFFIHRTLCGVRRLVEETFVIEMKGITKKSLVIL